MATNLTIDEVTQNVTLVVSNERGPAGAAGPNSVTSATTSDGTATLSLASASVTGTLTANHIHGNLAGSIYLHVRAGEALSKGDPVYVSGSHGTGASMVPIVMRADASNPAKMPAIAIMDAAVANNGDGHAVINGTITDLNTQAYAINSTLYVANGGGMTATKPANAQPVARVERSNLNNGGIVVKVNGLYSDAVTSASIAAALADDTSQADDIRDSIVAARKTAGGFVSNRPALMNTRWKLSALDHAAPTTPHVGIMLLGDSIASMSYTVGMAAQSLMETFGIGAFFTPGLGNTWNGAAWTLGGGATQATSDFTYLPGSSHITMGAGGSASITPGSQVPATATVNNTQTTRNFWNQGSPKGIKTVSFFYITSPGAGSITCTLTQDGSTHTPVTISTDAALGVGRVDFTLTDRHSAMTAAFSHSSGATVRALGVGFFFDKGVYFIDGSTGGTSMDQQNAWLSAPGVFADLVSELDTIAVWHAQKIDNAAEDYVANYTALFDYLDTLGLDALVFGETPDGTNDSFTATINEYLEAQAHERTYAYFDQWAALISLGYLASRGGWNTDAVHLNGPAWRYLAGILMDEMDNFRLAGQLTKQRPLIAATKCSDEMEFLAVQGMRTQHIDGHAGRSFEGAAISGTGFATSSSNERGWVLTGGTSAGHAAGRMWASNIGIPYPNLAIHDVAICFSGYRNFNLLAGMTGWFVFGTQSTVTDLASLPGKCFGVEFAVGSEVGSPGGITGPVCRIFAHNGTSIRSGRWLRVDAAGDASSSQAGMTFGFVWRKSDATLHMTKGSGGGTAPTYRHSSLYIPEFLTGTLNGQWAGIGLRAAGVATTGSQFSINAASIMWQQDAFPLPFPF